MVERRELSETPVKKQTVEEKLDELQKQIDELVAERERIKAKGTLDETY